MQSKIILAGLMATCAFALPQWGTGKPCSGGNQSRGPHEASRHHAWSTGAARPHSWQSGHWPTQISAASGVAAESDSPVAYTTFKNLVGTGAPYPTESKFRTRKHHHTGSGTPASITLPSVIDLPASSEIPASSEVPSSSTEIQLSTAALSPITTVALSPITTAAPSSATTAPTATSTSTSSSGDAYQDQIITHHNIHRTNHSAPALQWSASLASSAQKIASNCNFEHNTTVDGGGYGQNIEAGTPPGHVWSVITVEFYNWEVNHFDGLYGVADPLASASGSASFDDWGHFSQVVWRDTTSVGCATASCPNGVLQAEGAEYFTVCNYYPPGNVQGDFEGNVEKSIGDATVDTQEVPA